MWLTPFISSACYLIGGQWWKPARWFMGAPIFFIAIFNGASWHSIFVVATYWIATSVFSYGDKMWTSKIFGRWISMIISGIALGLASAPILGWTWGIVQAIIGGLSFGILKWLDDTDRLKNPWQELARGFFGTIVYFIA